MTNEISIDTPDDELKDNAKKIRRYANTILWVYIVYALIMVGVVLVLLFKPEMIHRTITIENIYSMIINFAVCGLMTIFGIRMRNVFDFDSIKYQIITLISIILMWLAAVVSRSFFQYIFLAIILEGVGSLIAYNRIRKMSTYQDSRKKPAYRIETNFLLAGYAVYVAYTVIKIITG